MGGVWMYKILMKQLTDYVNCFHREFALKEAYK